MKSFCLMFLFSVQFLFAQDSLRSHFINYKPNPYHLKMGINHNFKSKSVALEIGVLRDDFPFSLHRHGEWHEIVNHNTFISTEINIGEHFFIGPKIGYEFNCVFFQGRINLIDYFDFNGNNTPVVRPDLGITVFGLCSFGYGYNISLSGTNNMMIKPHTITLTYNKF